MLPKKDVLRTTFLLASKAIERLPVVRVAIEPLPRRVFLCGGIEKADLLLVSEEYELCDMLEDVLRRRTSPFLIRFNSSLIEVSSSMRRCWENSSSSP